MTRCENCDKVFKTNWHLQRHLSKKRICKEVPRETSFVPQETSFVPPETSLKCDYCCQEFSRPDSLNTKPRRQIQTAYI